MDTTTIATVTGFVATLLTLAGITGVTAADVQGFVTVVGALISLGAFIVAHFSHKSAVTTALNTPVPTQA